MKRRVVLIMLAMSVVGLDGCTRLTGSGEKVGSVIKVSQEGLFFKTNEVEIVRGGMNGGSGAFSTTPLNGTVNDDALYSQLKDALNGQYEVEVQYRDYWWTPLSSDSSSRYIVAVHKLAIPVSPIATSPSNPIVISNPVIEVHDGTIIIKSKQ